MYAMSMNFNKSCFMAFTSSSLMIRSGIWCQKKMLKPHLHHHVLYHVVGGLELILFDTERATVYTLEKAPVYHRPVIQRPTTNHAGTGRICKLQTQRPCPSWVLNPGPSCCDVTALTTACYNMLMRI